MLVIRSALSASTRSIGRLAFSTVARRPLIPQQLTGTCSPQKLSIRLVASSVANKPGSSSIPHAAQNIKEEMGHAIEDMAQAIAGGQQPSQLGSTAKNAALEGGFVGITSAVASTVPTPVMIFGLAGALPYLGTSGFTVYLANQAGEAASGAVSTIDPGVAIHLLDQAMSIQVTYGAVMLGFLGALHWGMEFAGYGGHKGSKRLLLGLAPTMLGWGTLALAPELALVTQWAGFTGLWYADMKATSAGWTPLWYSQYRFYLSILVGTCIIGTLAGTSYLGPTQSHSATLRELHKIRDERHKRAIAEQNTPVAPGEVGSISGVEEGADAFVLIKHAPEPKEEKDKKDKEKKELAATKGDQVIARVPYPKVNSSASATAMTAVPNSRPGPSRNHFPPQQRQPHRGGAAPSTISTSSSTSSNATVRPQATTPRALSPTSRQIPLPLHRGGSFRVSMLPGATKVQLNRHPHWDDPAKVGQDIALLDEKSVLEGLSWRLEQYLDIQEPYGLIVPEMVEAARQDPNDVCGPALDMLMSAIFADGDPPVCELPRVQTDASSVQHADVTVPLTSRNSPEALKNLFTSWNSVVQRLKLLDPRFHAEIARIICDMEPLENPLLPQVMLIAHDLKVIAKEISLRRGFLAKFDAAFLQMLKESDGGTLPAFPRTRTRLDSVGEDAEPPSSSNSSRSSSRSSHRARSRTQSLSNNRRDKASMTGDTELNGGSTRLPPTGLRSRSSSTHSLRLGKDGAPLSDAELAAEGIASATGSEYLAGGSKHPYPPPSPRQRHDFELSQRSGQNSHAVHLARSSSRSRREKDKYEYGTIAPLTIPAFSNDNSTSTNLANLASASSSQSRHLERPDSSIQAHSAPVSPAGTNMLGLPRMRDEDMPTRPLPRPGATSTDITASLSQKSRGPRPLPAKPSRPTKPNTSPPLTQPPPTLTVPSSSQDVPFSIPRQEINIPFIVPDQGGPSSVPVVESMPIQVPSSQPLAGFVVPSATEISDVVEVPSSSPYDLQVARQRYAMESSSSLPYMDERYPNPTRQRHYGQVDMSAFTQLNGNGNGVAYPPNGVPMRPATTEPAWYGDRRSGGSAWSHPKDWDDPPPPPPKDKEKESHSIFSGMKTWLRKEDKSFGSQVADISTAPPLSSRLSDGGIQGLEYSKSYASNAPDSAMNFYYGGVSPHSQQLSTPSSAGSRVQAPVVNGHGQAPYSIAPQHMMRPQHPGMIQQQQQQQQSSPTVSPGFAEAYQVNPVAARAYYGAGSSAPFHTDASYDPRREGTSTYGAHPPKSLPPPSTNSQPQSPEMVAIRETMYGAIADVLSTAALRQVTAKDEQRAYFSAVSLAILNVSMTLQSSTDSPNVVHMQSREVRLSDLPGAYRTCMTELAAIGREARKLSEEDDERAIAYVARGKPLPEPRVGRVRRLLERGVGYVGTDGRVRGAGSGNGGTGRSREFSNKINTLALELMKLPAFQEEMLRILVP